VNQDSSLCVSSLILWYAKLVPRSSYPRAPVVRDARRPIRLTLSSKRQRRKPEDPLAKVEHWQPTVEEIDPQITVDAERGILSTNRYGALEDIRLESYDRRDLWYAKLEIERSLMLACLARLTSTIRGPRAIDVLERDDRTRKVGIDDEARWLAT
jgi:hypothetical protein